MYLRSDEKETGKENFHAAVGSKPIRREFVMKAIRAGLTPRNGLWGYYFNCEKSLKEPLVSLEKPLVGRRDRHGPAGVPLVGRDQPGLHRRQGNRRPSPVEPETGVGKTAKRVQKQEMEIRRGCETQTSACMTRGRSCSTPRRPMGWRP